MLTLADEFRRFFSDLPLIDVEGACTRVGVTRTALNSFMKIGSDAKPEPVLLPAGIIKIAQEVIGWRTEVVTGAIQERKESIRMNVFKMGVLLQKMKEYAAKHH